MMKSLFLGAAFALAAGAANATVFSLTGTGGNLGPSEMFTSGMDSVTAFALNTETPDRGIFDLELRQSVDGLGVRSSILDQFTLDNVAADEAIVFDFAAPVRLNSLVLDMVRTNESFRIYGSDNPAVLTVSSGGLPALTALGTLIASGNGNGSGRGEGPPTSVDLQTLGTNTFRFLVVTPGVGPQGNLSGFFISSIDATFDAAVPVPGAIALMATGLAGFGFVSRRKRLI